MQRGPAGSKEVGKLSQCSRFKEGTFSQSLTPPTTQHSDKYSVQAKQHHPQANMEKNIHTETRQMMIWAPNIHIQHM